MLFEHVRRWLAAISASAFLITSLALPARADGEPGASQHSPIDLDLTSTTANLSAPHFVQNNPVDIMVGDAMKSITSGSILTPAERLAAYQVFSTGQQSIVIGAAGNAIGGSFTMGPQFSNYVNSLVIPTGVTAVKDFGIVSTLNLAGNLTNAGNFYAMSSNSAVTTATIMAANIINQQNALLTSILPANLPGFGSAASALNINLIALNEIINHGTISSSANLSMTAGGAITNTAAITAAQSAAIASAIGTINNSGLMTALMGNLNLSSQMAQSLAVNNIGGTLQALNGKLNASTAAAADLGVKPQLRITGGDMTAQQLNFSSVGGMVDINSNTMNGRLSIAGGDAHVTASTPNLILGEMNLTGDPTYWNAGGDVTIAAPMTASGTNLSFVASGNIVTASGAGAIDTSSTNFNGGAVLMIAGANFTSPTSGSGSNDTTTVITINGASSTGGMIDLTGAGAAPITSLNTQSTDGSQYDGGSVTLVAYNGTGTPGAGAGTILLPTNVTITTGTTANLSNSLNGSVTIIAGAPSGDAIQVGGINTSGNIINPQTSSNGQVLIASATPQFWGNPGGTGTAVTTITGAAFTDTSITVSDATNLTAGTTIFLNPTGSNGELLTILTTQAPASGPGTVLNFSTPMVYAHTTGDVVYVSATSMEIDPVGILGSVTSGYSATNNGGIFMPGTAQSGNISVGSASNPIIANTTITISTNAQATGSNGVVNINGSMNLTMNVTTATNPLVAYESFPTIAITGSAVNVATGVTVSSQIFTGPLSSPTTTYANAPNFINIVTQALTNNGTLTGGSPTSAPYSNSYINVSSPAALGLTLAGSGSFTVPSYSVIEIAASDGSNLNLGTSGGSMPTFTTGTGSVVIFNAQGSNGIITLAANQTATVAGGPIISINSPTLALGSGSQFNATGTSIYAIGSGYTADDLQVSILGTGNATIATASGGSIRLRPTDGQGISISPALSGTLTFTGAVARLATSGGGTTSVTAGAVPVASSYTIVTNPAGGILGGEFQPYPGGYFSSLNGSPPKFVSFSAYPFHVVIALLAPIAAEQQMQVVSTYTQQYSASYVIGAAKQLGLRVSAGVFVDIAADGTNLAPTRTSLDTTMALTGAQTYGNVIDIVVGNEDIVAGVSSADPSASVNTLISAITTAQSSRSSYTNPQTGLPFGASDLPVTTRQTIGVLTGDVTNYASMRTLLNTVDSHIYANIYPFFNEEIVIPGLIPGMSQSAFQTLVQTNMSLQYGNAATAFLNAKTAASTPVPTPPDIRVGETGWATELLTRTAAPGIGYNGSGLPQQSTQWAEWYYPAMQDWSFNYQNPITGNKGVIIAGYFGTYDEPWKGIDGANPGGSPASMSAASAGATSITTCCFGAGSFPTLTPMSVLLSPNLDNGTDEQEVQNILAINGSVLTVSQLLYNHSAGATVNAGHPEEPFFGIWSATGTYPLNSSNVNDAYNGYVFTLTGTTLKYSYSGTNGLPVYPAQQPPPAPPPTPVVVIPITPVEPFNTAGLLIGSSAINAANGSQAGGSTTIISIDQTPGITSRDDMAMVNQTDREDLFLSSLTLNTNMPSPSNNWQSEGSNSFYSSEFNSVIGPSNGQPGLTQVQSRGAVDFCQLSRGAALFTPSKTLQVQTQEGVIQVNNGAQAFVIETGHDVCVYNLHDSKHGGVKVVIGSKSIRVPLGKQLVLTRKPDAGFDEINPGATIANRNPQKLEFGDGVSGYIADFSIMSAVANIAPVKQMLTSKQPNTYKLGQQIIKNAAIMATIGAGAGPYKTSK